MKANKLSFLGLGALLLGAASCSSDLPDTNSNVYDGPVETNFLSVKLVAGGSVETRSGENDGTIYNDGNEGTYQDGGGQENNVESVRFYFFQENGTPANVKGPEQTLVNYYDWTVTDQEDQTTLTPDDNNIEKIVDAQVVINTAEGDLTNLYSIVAVVNPPTGLKNVTITSLNGDEATSLNNQVADYYVTAEGPFVMTNSVYLTGTPAAPVLQEDVPIADHIYSSPGAATADPVVIYVERVNAKARVTVEETAQFVKVEGVDYQGLPVYKTNNKIENLISYPDENPEGALEEDEDIYVAFLGWNVTCTTNQSYLMKHIGTNDQIWNNTHLFGTRDIDWNSPTRFRSFWAVNPTLNYSPGQDGNNYQYFSYNAITGLGLEFDATNNKNFTYLQENAGYSLTNPKTMYPTQLIVAARLLDSQGQALTLAEYGFNTYSYEGLQKKYASMANVYIRSQQGESPNITYTYTQIPWQAITFQTALAAGEANIPTGSDNGKVDDGGRYYVYAKLDLTNEAVKTALDAGNLYIGNTQKAVQATETTANESLVSLGHAKLWESGQTYYFIDIRHLGIITPGAEGAEDTTYPGTWGIVRNHIYAMNINALQGLGTPVYNPNEVIYPEKPKEEDSFIGAEIRILNWRLVNQNVGFAW